MISFLIFSSILSAVVAQEQPFLSCVYRLYAATLYTCDLTIFNPNGINNFTDIGGTHLDGFTNGDVVLLERVSGNSANIPSIICDTFPNITRFDFYNTGVTVIDDIAFGGCSHIYSLTLAWNRINSISSNAFANLLEIETIDMDSNFLTTLPENVFANQQNLMYLYINRNPFENIPDGLFQPLENLQSVDLSYNNLTAINNQWFASNTQLNQLYLTGNRIAVSADNFIGLDALTTLNLANNVINQIPVGALAGLTNLRNLFLNTNNFTELQADSFPDLENLQYLEIRDNPIGVIHDGAFRGLGNIYRLDLSYCLLREIHSNSFDGLVNLTSISLNFNQLEELPQDVFVPLPKLSYIGLWSNRLKTLRRNNFGTLASLDVLDLDGNVVNALDRAIVDDALILNTLFFQGNLCASNYFGSFLSNRAQYLLMLERCFVNFRYIVDTITEGDDEYSFFDGPDPGIALRVNTDGEIQIALTPFNFLWSPMIEIFIGTTNNTRSGIRVNQESNVVTVPIPNIITRDQWNDFRITWANQNILVYRGNDTFPFMGFTMQDFFPVNFYGLRAVGTRATWSVQPFL